MGIFRQRQSQRDKSSGGGDRVSGWRREGSGAALMDGSGQPPVTQQPHAYGAPGPGYSGPPPGPGYGGPPGPGYPPPGPGYGAPPGPGGPGYPDLGAAPGYGAPGAPGCTSSSWLRWSTWARLWRSPDAAAALWGSAAEYGGSGWLRTSACTATTWMSPWIAIPLHG